jgi:hypothetical protein
MIMSRNRLFTGLVLALCIPYLAPCFNLESEVDVVSYLENKGYNEYKERPFDEFSLLDKVYKDIFHEQYDIRGGIVSANVIMSDGIEYELLYAKGRMGAPNLISIVYYEQAEKTRIFVKINYELQGEIVFVTSQYNPKEEYSRYAFY